MKDIIVLRE